MQYKKLPNTDINISVITLGTWVMSGDAWSKADDTESIRALHAALDRGINCIDTAPIYGWGHSETIVGKALKGKRDTVFIATKCGLVNEHGRINHDLSAASIAEEVEASLQRLQTDHIDLYQCHRPDPATPIEETMAMLKTLQVEGKIRYIGVSNFSDEQLTASRKYAEVVSVQSQYSLLERSIETDLMPYCASSGVGILAYGPLGGGILTGKYTAQPVLKRSDPRHFFYRYYREPMWSKVHKLIDMLRQIADNHHIAPGEVALNWVVQHDEVTSALVGCRNPEQVYANSACADWLLDDDEIALLDELSSTLLEQV